MQKKFITVVCAGIALILAGCAATPTPASSDAPTPSVAPSTPDTATAPAQSQYTITLSDAGFSPADLTIPLGSKVTFVNEASVTMWPASDPHPTHTAYAAFDSLVEIAPGGTYMFMFNEAGTWAYHDHMAPSKKGVIIVE